MKNIAPLAQLVEQLTLNPRHQSAGGCAEVLMAQAGYHKIHIFSAPLAQLVEQLTLNQRVEGSSPSGRTILGKGADPCAAHPFI